MLALLLLLISEPSTMSSNEFDWDALMNPALQQPLQTMVSHCKPRQTVPFTSVPASAQTPPRCQQVTGRAADSVLFAAITHSAILVDPPR